MKSILLLSAIALTFAAPASGVSLIVNEFNSVAPNRYLAGEFYTTDNKTDAYFGTLPGMNGDGRIQGNGGDWMELVVVEDHVDLRNWQLRWGETYTPTTPGPTRRTGVITFANDILWSDLRRGTIITISQKRTLDVDTTPDGLGNKNFTDGIDETTADVVIDLSTDVSYNPQGGDWWLHISTRTEAESTTPLLTTTINNPSNFPGGPPGPGDFSVTNDDWDVAIYTAAGVLHQGPVGEAAAFWAGGGINSSEVGKLEQDPSSNLGAAPNYKDGTSSSFGLPNVWTSGGVTRTQDFAALRSGLVFGLVGDFNADGRVDAADYTVWRDTLGSTTMLTADANHDGTVNQADYDLWRENFGQLSGTLSTAGGSVPEPTAWVLMCGAALIGVLLRSWGS